MVFSHNLPEAGRGTATIPSDWQGSCRNSLQTSRKVVAQHADLVKAFAAFSSITARDDAVEMQRRPSRVKTQLIIAVPL
jgi:hypothetical protein